MNLSIIVGHEPKLNFNDHIEFYPKRIEVKNNYIAVNGVEFVGISNDADSYTEKTRFKHFYTREIEHKEGYSLLLFLLDEVINGNCKMSTEDAFFNLGIHLNQDFSKTLNIFKYLDLHRQYMKG